MEIAIIYLLILNYLDRKCVKKPILGAILATVMIVLGNDLLNRVVEYLPF